MAITDEHRELAEWFAEQIEDGQMDIEGLPLRLARYGLMDPTQFRAEMKERMQGLDA